MQSEIKSSSRKESENLPIEPTKEQRGQKFII